MKMSPLTHLTAFICAVFIIDAAFGQEKIVEKFGVIGGEVSFGPESLTLPVSTIAWKQNSSGSVVKAIEWDGDEPDVKQRFSVLNPRFKGITTLDEKTGRITIKNVNTEHAGLYIFEINSKEQGHKIKLGLMSSVPKPEIIKIQLNKDTVYLECRYNDTIIWKNSTGETLEGSPIQPRGQSITVHNTGNPENFYTCTLKNAASESTSDRVYERDLFSSGSNGGLIAGILIPIILIVLIIVYVFVKRFRDQNNAGRNKAPDTGKKEPECENNSLLEAKDNDTVAEGQKSAEGNPDTTEISNENVKMDKLNSAGPDKKSGEENRDATSNEYVNMDEPNSTDQNNTGQDQDPETEALYDVGKIEGNPEAVYDKVLIVDGAEGK